MPPLTHFVGGDTKRCPNNSFIFVNFGVATGVRERNGSTCIVLLGDFWGVFTIQNDMNIGHFYSTTKIRVCKKIQGACN